MSKKDEILTEIYSLITEQMEALRVNLTFDEAKTYADRKRRLEQLLERLRQDGTIRSTDVVL